MLLEKFKSLILMFHNAFRKVNMIPELLAYPHFADEAIVLVLEVQQIPKFREIDMIVLKASTQSTFEDRFWTEWRNRHGNTKCTRFSMGIMVELDNFVLGQQFSKQPPEIQSGVEHCLTSVLFKSAFLQNCQIDTIKFYYNSSTKLLSMDYNLFYQVETEEVSVEYQVFGTEGLPLIVLGKTHERWIAEWASRNLIQPYFSIDPSKAGFVHRDQNYQPDPILKRTFGRKPDEKNQNLVCDEDMRRLYELLNFLLEREHLSMKDLFQ